ncbi:DNA-binding PucR family transcriptional regulator [Streptomyces sp. Amel2xB2]|uniref:PucR family transcriptional regulator n=1 Tax=Streptomyces sp. Amel2xB2 TaxID=1305829 RepID=UPI000DBA1779|nr:helix-turn-helix domain-containing protein [Streptomyces sp. Amel2xB2]RAJ62461.1 DNA-binding PucR family transcriptional regulator [Streptomyces sp. Amel2xB2]
MSADVDALVAEVAQALDADLPALTDEMTTWFVEVIPEFRHDEAVRELMVASTSSNLVAIVDLLRHSIPVEQISVPAAAAEYARRFAQHSLSLEALLRAYRLGENRFTQWGITALDRLGDVPTHLALAAVAELSRRTNSYIDRVIEGLIDIYETERRLWNSRVGAARAARIRLVLASEGMSEVEARHLLGIPVSGWHTAAVAWLPAEAPGEAGTLDAAARVIQRAFGPGTPLTLLNDARTMWVWVQHQGPHAVDLDGLHEGMAGVAADVRVALGAQAPGLDGFRGSLREAIRTQAVAGTAQNGDLRVLSFDDVAVAALLTETSEDLAHWISRTLGDLAADDPGTPQLRDTVRAFLESGCSYTQAASRLHLHKNTVHYRVRKAEELIGRALTDDRLNLEVALMARALLWRRLPRATTSPAPGATLP